MQHLIILLGDKKAQYSDKLERMTQKLLTLPVQTDLTGNG